MPQTLREARPVARKAHRCLACGGQIEPGTKYRRVTSLFEDRVYDWLTCGGCEGLTATVWLWAGRPDEGVCEEDFYEWAHEDRETPAAAAWLVRHGCRCEQCEPGPDDDSEDRP